jgi:hypothetical protein
MQDCGEVLDDSGPRESFPGLFLRDGSYPIPPTDKFVAEIRQMRKMDPEQSSLFLKQHHYTQLYENPP